ncbi:MAG: response regulator [Alphaproteobacteria bacterium]|nr:response regulator [Alphaproteobacteria bacterium]
MKILIADRDEASSQFIKNTLTAAGHTVDVEGDKNKALERLASQAYDVVFLDPAPLTSARPVVLNIRRGVQNYPYMVLLSSEERAQEDAIKAGTNDILLKPVDPALLQEVADNASRFIKLVQHLGDDSEDFPSAGGVIAKSAFNQLFLSAIDRADRYGERTCLLFISMNNYGEILQLDGRYSADYAVAKLCRHLVHLRRQSDIIGQTGKNEYVLLLQRPIYETEPLEAAARFAEAFAKYEINDPAVHFPVQIRVELVQLPVGSQLVEHVLTINNKSAA